MKKLQKNIMTKTSSIINESKKIREKDLRELDRLLEEISKNPKDKKLIKRLKEFLKKQKGKGSKPPKKNDDSALGLIEALEKLAEEMDKKTKDNANVGRAIKNAFEQKSKQTRWTKHDRKHIPQKNISWKNILEDTKHGDAKYKHNIDIELLEKTAWSKGKPTTNDRNWKVMKFNDIIGAKKGIETKCVRVECSANTIHGHPIPLSEYRSLLK